MPRLSVAWVMLQRVPPDMRILTPARRVLLEQQDAPAALRRADGRHQPGGPAPDHHDVCRFVGHDQESGVMDTSRRTALPSRPGMEEDGSGEPSHVHFTTGVRVTFI